VDRP